MGLGFIKYLGQPFQRHAHTAPINTVTAPTLPNNVPPQPLTRNQEILAAIVALKEAVSRGQRWEDDGRDQHIVALPTIDPPQQALASPSPATSSGSAERQIRPKRARGTAKEGAAKKKKGSKPPKWPQPPLPLSRE